MRGLGDLRLPRFALCFVCTLVTAALPWAPDRSTDGRRALGSGRPVPFPVCPREPSCP